MDDSPRRSSPTGAATLRAAVVVSCIVLALASRRAPRLFAGGPAA